VSNHIIAITEDKMADVKIQLLGGIPYKNFVWRFQCQSRQGRHF
jgi:hypothetical protein